MSLYDFKWLSESPAWRQTRDRVWSLSKGEVPIVSKHQGTHLKKLQRSHAEAGERLRAYEERLGLLKAQCPHPKEDLVLQREGREDDYGSYLSGSRNYVECKRCRTFLKGWTDYGDGTSDWDGKG